MNKLNIEIVAELAVLALVFVGAAHSADIGAYIVKKVKENKKK